MKIAVLFAGMARHYEKCYHTILDYFNVDGIEVDFFIHAWSNIWFVKRGDSFNRVDRYDESLESKLCDIYNPKQIVVEDQLQNKDLRNTIKEIKSFSSHAKHFHNFHNWKPLWWKDAEENEDQRPFLDHFHLGQIYSISKAAQLKRRHEKENDFRYDLVFRSRLDNFMRCYDNNEIKDMCSRLISNCGSRPTNRDLLCCQWMSMHGTETSIGDKFFAASSETFDLFRNLFSLQIIRVFKDFIGPFYHCQFSPEFVIGDLVKEHNLVCKRQAQPSHLFSYRDYHVNLEDQSFQNLFKEYLAKEL